MKYIIVPLFILLVLTLCACFDLFVIMLLTLYFPLVDLSLPSVKKITGAMELRDKYARLSGNDSIHYGFTHQYWDLYARRIMVTVFPSLRGKLPLLVLGFCLLCSSCNRYMSIHDAANRGGLNCSKHYRVY